MDPTLDPTPFFGNFKDAKYNFSSFFIAYLQLHYFSLKNLIFSKILCYNFISNHYFSPLNTFMRKEKDTEPDLDPYHLTNESRSWRHGSGSGSPTPAFWVNFKLVKLSFYD
jgi:hypothetical protein